MLKDDTDAKSGDVLGMFAEEILTSLEGFKWRSSFRTWAYRIAWHCLCSHWKDPRNDPKRQERLSQIPELRDLVDRNREATREWLKTSMKDRFQQLRKNELNEEEQTILILHVDRRLKWKEVAFVMFPDEVITKTKIDKVKKRFQRIKTKLEAAARKQGLLDPEPSTAGVDGR